MGSHYINSGLGVASETTGSVTTYYTRTPGGHLVSQRTAAGSYYYLFDGLGSVVGMVDPYGNLVARYGYDPYGQTVVKHGPDSNPGYLTIADGNPFRYTGAYLDGTGLYHMGERYYDPARGRFTQRDPLGNRYVYASDDPVNFIDPSGLNDGDPSETGFTGPLEAVSSNGASYGIGRAYAEGGVTSDGRIFINVFIPDEPGIVMNFVGTLTMSYSRFGDWALNKPFISEVSSIAFPLRYEGEIGGYIGNFLSDPAPHGSYYASVSFSFIDMNLGGIGGRYASSTGGILHVR